MTAAQRRGALQRVRETATMPAIALALAFVTGAVLMIVSSPLIGGEFDPSVPFVAYPALFGGAFGSLDRVVETIVNATPLVLAGLAVGIGFKGGLFNIGAQGQFLMGALSAVAAALALNDASPFVAIPVSLLAGMLGGMLWGAIPGALKAWTGAHEVVTTIMLNYVAIFVVAWVISAPLRGTNVEFSRTDDVVAAALPVVVGGTGHLGIFLIAIAVPVAWWLLFRSTVGFEIRTTGANPDAARYAGMRPRWLMIFTMGVCGMFAGLAGASNLLGEIHYMPASYATTVGWDAIAVALLGRSHPVGILFAALLFGAMKAGAGQMQILAGVPLQMVSVLQAIILLFLTAEVIIRQVFRLRAAQSTLPEPESAPQPPGKGG